jgi:hypothetical protein
MMQLLLYKTFIKAGLEELVLRKFLNPQSIKLT